MGATYFIDATYSIRSIGDVLNGIVHFFGFAQKSVDFAFLVDFLAFHVGQLEELVSKVVDCVELTLDQGDLVG